jgi:hypothetical protein
MKNCVVANMYAVFWFNKQNEFELVGMLHLLKLLQIKYTYSKYKLNLILLSLRLS